MDCKNARLLLEFARPHAPELEAADREVLDNHLAECAECSVAARDEQLVDARLHAAMTDVRVPEGLREVLKLELQLEQTTRRRPFWRRRSMALAAAAAVLLLATLSLFWSGKRMKVDLEWVPVEVADGLRTTLEVQQFFATNHGIKVEPPSDREFNYAFLANCSMGAVHGKPAPQLFFINGNATAWVYVLNDRDFDFSQALTQPPLGTGGVFVVLRPHATDRHIAYLIIYKGGPLDLFLLATGQPQT